MIAGAVGVVGRPGVDEALNCAREKPNQKNRRVRHTVDIHVQKAPHDTQPRHGLPSHGVDAPERGSPGPKTTSLHISSFLFPAAWRAVSWASGGLLFHAWKCGVRLGEFLCIVDGKYAYCRYVESEGFYGRGRVE